MKLNYKEIFQYGLGAVIVLGFFYLLILLLRKEVPESNSALLNITVGSLLGSFSTIVGYFYGSSKGSSDKNEIIKSKSE